MAGKRYPETPDGRYFVAKDRLWRKSDPSLSEDERQEAVNALMTARRAVRDAGGEAEVKAAREKVDAAKRRLGERGPVWWRDGAPDETRKAPWNSSYAAWWAGLGAGAGGDDEAS
ncbi:hypothetical protein DYI37_15010 [Fulvimarina endophytica]|uniref:Uncharacterized protein n=1 Tax=Fulvimarina endophytica TaxID=2293836 RepID=A0A371X012_9HYPH|nr:hypothetical protein [Fulvimarina endophytica]RFC62559.1 hypothetical protein DYI37_15010 [Fulvimarina endophytica]